MYEGFDSSRICRDDNCTILEVHARHFVEPVSAPPRPHHRPKKIKCARCTWRGQASFDRTACPKCDGELIAVRERQPWEADDQVGLTRAVAQATSKAYPVTFSMIARDVWDDYGACDERTIHRHLAKLVDRGCLLKFNINLPFAVYIRPGTRLDLETIREYDYQHVETKVSPWRARR